MSFGTAVRTCFSTYGDFNGRARRSEFWRWYLFVILVTLAPTLVAVIVPFVITVLLSLAVPVSLALLVPTHAALPAVAGQPHDDQYGPPPA